MNLLQILSLTLCFIFLTSISPNIYAQDGAAAAEDDWPDNWTDDWEEEDGESTTIHGFLELGYGRRIVSSTQHQKHTLGDTRARMEWLDDIAQFNLTLKADLNYDSFEHQWRIKLRSLNVQTDLTEKLSLKVGRQVLTWGTGDYLFLNDLFAKDWVSFLSGRDDEYLKAPSDAIKLSAYSSVANINFVWMPEFSGDEYLTGERFSFFQPTSNPAPEPPKAPNEGEFAVRAYTTISSTEVALYGYQGFTGQPLASNTSGAPNHTKLKVLGASLSQPVTIGRHNGLMNVEYARHQYRRSNNTISIPQNQDRFLVGYEFELLPRITTSFQYYLERPTQSGPSKNRSVITQRLGYRSKNENLTVSSFLFYSPSEKDFYWRPSGSYRLDDTWKVSFGINLFGGDKNHTNYGQFSENDNIWLRIRMSY